MKGRLQNCKTLSLVFRKKEPKVLKIKFKHIHKTNEMVHVFVRKKNCRLNKGPPFKTVMVHAIKP